MSSDQGKGKGKEVRVVTKQSIERQGASGGQTGGMIRQNAVVGVSEVLCSSSKSWVSFCSIFGGFGFAGDMGEFEMLAKGEGLAKERDGEVVWYLVCYVVRSS